MTQTNRPACVAVAQRPRFRAPNGERGTALVQVTVALLALLAFGVFVLDYGIVWVARTQAQNAADAAALAGAVSLAYEDTPSHAKATARARDVATGNLVLERAPLPGEVTITYPNSCPYGPPPCIRVDVERRDLIVGLGHLIGITAQRVRATATAMAAVADRVECIRPFGLPDRWDEFTSPKDGIVPLPIPPPNMRTSLPWTRPADLSDTDFDSGSTFDRWNPVATKPGDIPPEPDVYQPPVGDAPGTGYRNANPDGTPVDRGRQVVLKLGTNDTPGWSRLLDLNGSGGATIRDLIVGDYCGPEQTTQIAPSGLPCSGSKDANSVAGCVQVEDGMKVGPTVNQGITDLMAKDLSAKWDRDGKTVVNSTYEYSPRIIPIPTFDPNLFYAQYATGKNGVIKVTNIMGVFVEGTCTTGGFYLEPENAAACSDTGPNKPKVVVIGRILNYRGARSENPPIGPGNSFLKTIMLVR